MSTKYEVGGHLIDAHGNRWPILDTDISRPTLLKINDVDVGEWVWADFFLYEPPTKTLTLQEAIEAAKAGETVEHRGNVATWISMDTGPMCLVFTASNNPVQIREHHLTGWRIVKAKPLPKMTERLAEALEVYCNYWGESASFLTRQYKDLVSAYREAKGGAK